MPIRLLPALLAIALSACSDDDFGTTPPGQDMSVQVVSDMTVPADLVAPPDLTP